MAVDFSAADDWLAQQVRDGTLAGVSYAVAQHGRPLAERCFGDADRERGEPLRRDHVFRAFSNTKLVTSCAALLLHDEGRFGLDDPVAEWIPALRTMRVLRPGATTLDDSVPAAGPITIRQLLTHTAGFSHGVFDPGTLIYRAYGEHGIRRPDTTLEEECEALGRLPLLFPPGQGWEYSTASDVLARLVEVASGQRFGDFLAQRVFGPLGLVDSGFVLRDDQRPRFTALYGAADPAQPLAPGLKRLDGVPYPEAWLKPVARQSGAGGLLTTLPDMMALLDALRPGPGALLKPATLAALATDQLPPELSVRFPEAGVLPDLGFGLAGALTREASARGTAAMVGELQWGGLAGTHWFIQPRLGLVGALMTQRFMGFWHPFWFEFKRRLYQAVA